MTAFDWDSKISQDGGDFQLLPVGIYPFTVKKLAKDYYNGGATIPACPKATLTLRVGSAQSGMSDVIDSLLLDDSLEWKLCQFFKAIGARKHGEEIQMNWDAVEGKGGWLEIEHREYQKDGETRTANQVKRYIDPADVPAQQPQPQQAAPVQAAGASW